MLASANVLALQLVPVLLEVLLVEMHPGGLEKSLCASCVTLFPAQGLQLLLASPLCSLKRTGHAWSAGVVEHVVLVFWELCAEVSCAGEVDSPRKVLLVHSDACIVLQEGIPQEFLS